jgi:ubiquinone/menaquinone biosynthesis C-methylase UbiE
MGLYSRFVFPRLCEWALDNRVVAEQRAKLLERAQGEILEIGIGTGLNLPYYPEQVRKIVAVDPNVGMHRKAEARIAQHGIEVDKRVLGGEALPFEAGSFDYVVSTFTLCSIPQVEQALAEIFRVLKAGGTFLFLEHGLSPDPRVQKWQHRLNGLQRALADNCHLNRDIRQLAGSQPYGSIEVEQFYLDKMPRTHAFVSRGAAIK